MTRQPSVATTVSVAAQEPDGGLALSSGLFFVKDMSIKTIDIIVISRGLQVLQPYCRPAARQEGSAGGATWMASWIALWLCATLAAVFCSVVPALAADPPAEAQPSADASAQVSDQNSQLRSELEQLKQLVQQQQARIAALEVQQSVTTTGGANDSMVDLLSPMGLGAVLPPTASAPQSGSVPAQAQVPPTAGSSDERIRNLERRIKGLGPISFSGDIRVREESIMGGPVDGSTDRNRGRIRARLNAFAQLSDELQAGLSLMSGDVNDPTSTNSTMGVFYTRKPIALDQAFVTYNPKFYEPLTLTAGKFRYPWYNTELTWDKDLNPEGAAQTIAYNLKSTPVLKRIAVVGFELPFAEEQGTNPTSRNYIQSMVYGGQLQTMFQIAPRVRLSVYTGYYNFQNADTIAQALAKASAKNPATPWAGSLPLANANAPQNSITTTTSANVVTINGKAYPTGVTNVVNAQFGSKFGLFDTIARLDWNTGNPKLPVYILGDYVQNTRACANVVNITPKPANTASLVFAQTTNYPCNASQRRGYWLEARVGRLLERRDWQAAYTRIFVEREAVISNLNYNEMRQGSNVTEHRFDLFYMFRSNVQLGAAALIGRPLGVNALGKTEPWQTKLQFDTIYIF